MIRLLDMLMKRLGYVPRSFMEAELAEMQRRIAALEAQLAALQPRSPPSGDGPPLPPPPCVTDATNRLDVVVANLQQMTVDSIDPRANGD